MNFEAQASSRQLVDPALLRAVRREHVLAAIVQLDKGMQTGFAESTKYDLVFNNRRYPPKRVAGLALQSLTGMVYGPGAFKGGSESACFGALQSAGFTISPKLNLAESSSVAKKVGEIADLQKNYSSRNTAPLCQTRCRFQI